MDGLYAAEQTAELRDCHDALRQQLDAVQQEIHTLERDSVAVRDFVTRTAREYGEAVSRRVLLEEQLDELQGIRG